MEQNEILQALASALQGVVKATGTPTAIYNYSEGGLFGSCKNDPVLVNALVGPYGIMSKLRWQGTANENPVYEALTYIGSSGYAQSGVCADCGKPTVKRCAQTACFGRVCQMTDEVVFDELGLKANAQVNALALFGNVTDPSGNVLLGMGQEIGDAFLTSVMAAGYNLRRRIGELIWTGNAANNAGGYFEFPGFDQLINTGYQDAFTGIVCPAMDSVLVNYGSNVVGATGSPSIVAYISHTVRRIWYRMDTAGLARDTANMFIVMHPSIADCVFDAYACEYGLTCQTGATNSNDQLAVSRLRDDMKNGSYLVVDGVRIPVVLDNGIDTSFKYIGDDSGLCADIYVITTDINGKTITWGEYQDFDQTGGKDMAWFKGKFGAAPVAVTDGGRFAIAPTTSGGFCFDVRILTKPRLIALMPQLLGRVQNVCCVNIGHYPDVTGSGGLYEVDGGATTTPPNYLYGECWPTRMLHGGAGR